jgi:hypothetical protein
MLNIEHKPEAEGDAVCALGFMASATSGKCAITSER